MLNRAQNENHMLLADARKGETREVFVERDDAWVDVHDETFWLDGGDRVTWISERDGWRHAYELSLATGEARQFTQGEFDVIRLLRAKRDHGWAYFVASPDDATRRYLYRCGSTVPVSKT